MSYDVAQICPNGHVINDNYKKYPEYNKEYCDKCGEKTITNCPKCTKEIRGRLLESAIFSKAGAPAFCQYCGAMFPWTESSKQAAIDMFVDEIESKEAQEAFKQSVDQIVKDTPQAGVASGRINKLLKTVSKESAKFIYNTMMEFASKTAAEVLTKQQ